MTNTPLPDDVVKHRKPEYPVDPLFLSRWSPRAFTGEVVDEKSLMSLFEAAKWAPSSYNNQPWRFIYATRNSKHWTPFFDLLVPFNQSWADKAGALVIVVSKKTHENGKASVSHSLDTGAAYMSLCLEATLRHLSVHPMEGFDYEKAAKLIHLPEGYVVETMLAIGKKAPKEFLKDDLLEREFPKGRKSLSELVFEGKMGKD
ncbi:MAG: nitroreductase family protein [Simkaniaceae bacterium]|nr:nitroreductase family protein [Simkaniaceae bacterium]